MPNVFQKISFGKVTQIVIQTTIVGSWQSVVGTVCISTIQQYSNPPISIKHIPEKILRGEGQGILTSSEKQPRIPR